jgi:hypothetical protein
MQSSEWPDLEFRAPRSYTRGRAGGARPRLIVWHYTAGHEGPDDAENGAAYDGRRADGTSAHYYVDSNSTVQCVLTSDTAHTALYNGNRWGIQYELCGTRQSRAQWLDPVSSATITQAARQAARDGAKYGIPVRKLTPAQVRAGESGHCGHADVTAAWPEDGGDHTDPGPEFPWDVALARVQQLTAGGGEIDMGNVPGDMLRRLADGQHTYTDDDGEVKPLVLAGWEVARYEREMRLLAEVAELREQIKRISLGGVDRAELVDAVKQALREGAG